MSIQDLLIQWLSSVPSWLSTILLSTVPLGELRFSIPVAITIYGMDPVMVYILAVIGNLIPVIILLVYLEPVSQYLRRFKIFDIFFTWLFERTRVKHTERYEKYGTLALTFFVAIPLPVTGAWTACVAAFVFGIKFTNALLAISLGVLIAGIIVTLVTLMGIDVISFFWSFN
ncbi:putative small multi-drug export [Methanosalsum zhilinae DSM 4017]|uniref:Putative small multi-drug export n=1 Tax=Methanosalsum zhilinae (strain DSM 4017 / NBRC 107636 / OCM 62 / WeN5) TaxID=679901 RepID=F7XPN8_METZD|nr:small multi-drug export protein [Methanosalsum zhilinae]AEH60308.1 putative small multi-drug export [Methanosalsum zhilinae DSM 4017]